MPAAPAIARSSSASSPSAPGSSRSSAMRSMRPRARARAALYGPWSTRARASSGVRRRPARDDVDQRRVPLVEELLQRGALVGRDLRPDEQLGSRLVLSPAHELRPDPELLEGPAGRGGLHQEAGELETPGAGQRDAVGSAEQARTRRFRRSPPCRRPPCRRARNAASRSATQARFAGGHLQRLRPRGRRPSPGVARRACPAPRRADAPRPPAPGRGVPGATASLAAAAGGTADRPSGGSGRTPARAGARAGAAARGPLPPAAARG